MKICSHSGFREDTTHMAECPGQMGIWDEKLGTKGEQWEGQGCTHQGRGGMDPAVG
jgi:hypothetical protein